MHSYFLLGKPYLKNFSDKTHALGSTKISLNVKSVFVAGPKYNEMKRLGVRIGRVVLTAERS